MNDVQLCKIISEELAGLRLDQALAQLFPQFSRSKLQQWIESGNVRLDQNIILKTKERVHPGQSVIIQAQLENQQEWIAEQLPLNIVYEDEALTIINKPPGLIVHPGAGNPKSTLVNALLHYDPELRKLPRAGLIHRLDKDTSGLLIIARTLQSHHFLSSQMQERKICRIYEAIVQGRIISNGTVNEPIGRHPTQRKKMSVLKSGKPAITHYSAIARFAAHSYLEIKLETGRTHQIRVHMAYIHHPVVGDPVYGRPAKLDVSYGTHLVELLKNFKRQALHAKKIIFKHPFSEEELIFSAPLPDDFALLLQAFQENVTSQ